MQEVTPMTISRALELLEQSLSAATEAVRLLRQELSRSEGNKGSELRPSIEHGPRYMDPTNLGRYKSAPDDFQEVGPGIAVDRPPPAVRCSE